MARTSSRQRERPNVFAYGDYRRFLADRYAYEKVARYGFSVRVFARRARIRSSNYLRLVIDGKRNLSREMAARFAQGCELSGAEADFFCELVDYCQAKSSLERNRSYERLAHFRQFRSVRQLDSAQAEYHANWYLPVIRELVRRSDFREDARWIASQLLPRIPAREAKRALALLLRLGLLERAADGALRQSTPLVTTGSGPLGHHIFNYHHIMLERAGAALDTLAQEEREVSCISVCVSQATMLELKERVRAFRRELLQIAELGNEPERVVQINFQLFPMSVAVAAGPTQHGSATEAPPPPAKAIASAAAKRRRGVTTQMRKRV